MPYDSDERRCRIVARHAGPLLVEGPVDVTLEHGTSVSSYRLCVALCTYPWCDTSHRRSEPPVPHTWGPGRGSAGPGVPGVPDASSEDALPRPQSATARLPGSEWMRGWLLRLGSGAPSKSQLLGTGLRLGRSSPGNARAVRDPAHCAGPRTGGGGALYVRATMLRAMRS
ncbi:hypothetical protein GCM10012280_64810 [Wenjunlia tyrosinilytica]|uniref:Uncharacterized protein n=1 Tax=Wenjunlia tyrosinilytica TaxID=1544741 RepID=A0A918E2C5_9ACTN|nr:hypothetical protein GCM10012280_64810 [Wenjunlia tyrosinilytica]